MSSTAAGPPLQLGSLFQRAIDLVRTNLGALVVVALVVSIPTQALVIGGALAAGGSQQRILDVGQALGTVAGVLTGYLITIAAIEVVRRAQAGDTVPASASDLLAVTGRWFLPVLGVSILVGIGVFLGTLALILPGIFLAVRWALATPALVIEEKGIVEAMKSSWHLVMGRWWQVLGFLLVGYLVPTLVVGIVGGLVQAGGNAIADEYAWQQLIWSGAGNVITSAFALPFTGVFVSLLYFALRTTPVAAPRPVTAGTTQWPGHPAPSTSDELLPPPPPPPPPAADAPLPGGYLPPRPGTAGGTIPPPPERPPAAD